jgi:hypothetical protein
MYYASLKTEESRQIVLSIAYIDPQNPDPDPPKRIVNDRWVTVPFKDAIPANVRNLVKLAAASDPRSSTFAVFETSPGEITVWGLIDQQNQHHDFINYNAESGPQRPGWFQATALALGHLRVSLGYETIAELKVNALLRRKPDVLRRGPIFQKLESGIKPYVDSVIATIDNPTAEDLSFWPNIFADWWITSLCRLLLRIQGYRHGGAILITRGQEAGRLNVKHSIQYPRIRTALQTRATHAFQKYVAEDVINQEYLDGDLTEMPVQLYLDASVNEGEENDARSEIDGAIWFASLLSRVDGLILMDPNLEIQGFGVEITVPDEPGVIYLADEPEAPAYSLRECPYTHFGTRHRSMMRYCALVPEAVGFVVSQDGDVRAITTVEGRVVMWEDIKLQFEVKKRRRPRRRKKPRKRIGSAPRSTSV